MFDNNSYRKEVLKPLLDDGRADDDPFALFAIPLDEDDTAAIKARVDEVVAFWRKEQSSPRYRNLVTTLLKDRDTLSQLVLDPAARNQCRQRIRTERDAQNAARFQQIDELLARLNSRWGGVPTSRLDRLRSAANRVGVSNAEFDQRLRGFTIIDDSESTSTATPPPEVRHLARALLVEFSQLHEDEPARVVRTLFDFVGVEPDASRATITAARDRIGARNRQRRHDRLRTVVDELLALVTDLLLEGSTPFYLAGLVADAADNIRPQVETALVVEDRLTAIEFERLLRTVIGAGIDPASARAAVLSVAREVGIPVETGQAVDYVVCASCRAANPTGLNTRQCENCAADLYLNCPGCSNRVARSAAICRSCSYDLAALRLVEGAVAEARVALADGRVLDATERLRGLETWANDIGAMVAVRAEIEQAHRSATSRWAEAMQLLAEGRLDEAASATAELRRSARDVPAPDGRSVESFGNEVAAALVAIRRDIAAAGSLSDAERERAILALAERYPNSHDVLAELRGLPVTAPSRVMAIISSETVRISWKPARSLGPVTYRVSRVTHNDDTEQSRSVGSTSETSLEDGGAVAGQVVSYEVRAVRHGIQSGRVGTRQQLIAFEVARLAAIEHDGAIELRWTRMVGHSAIWVERTDLTDPAEPTRRTRASDTGSMDTNVTADHRYSYRVYVEYLHGTERKATAGRTIAATAFVAPDAPELTVVDVTAMAVTLTTNGGRAASVVRCATDPQLSAGTLVDARQFERLGAMLTADTHGRFTDRVTGAAAWYVPAALFATQAVVGTPLVHPGIADISNLTALVAGDRVVVRWNWPAGCTEALVTWAAGRVPVAAHDPSSTTTKVTNTTYSINGGWMLNDPPSGRLAFLVRPGRRIGSELVVVPGAPQYALAYCTVAEPQTFSYSVRRTGRRKRELQVDISAPTDANVPRLVIVAHPADGSTAAGGGEILGVVPSGAASAVVPLEGIHLPVVISVRPESGPTTRFRIDEPDTTQRTIS